MAANVDRDDVRADQRRDLVPAVGEVEKAVDQHDRGIAGRVPLEDVRVEAVRERELLRQHRGGYGCACTCQMLPAVSVS